MMMIIMLIIDVISILFIYVFSLTFSSEMSNISHAATNEHLINFLSYKLIWISAAYVASAIEKMIVNDDDDDGDDS